MSNLENTIYNKSQGGTLVFCGTYLASLGKKAPRPSEKAALGELLRGLLITLEGIEGSGKSTQMRFLQSRLSDLNIPHICSREPGGTSLGKELRTLLLAPHPSGEKWGPTAELLLFSADRAHHVETVVEPALRQGKIVLLDRFEDSTKAYQGAQGIPFATMSTLGQIVLNGLVPDMTILLDADPEKALARTSVRNRAKDGFSETRFDAESLAFHKKVREEFLKIAHQEPSRIRIINGEASQEAVSDNVWAAVAQKLAQQPAGLNPRGATDVR
jgi:dTMP kinase